MASVTLRWFTRFILGDSLGAFFALVKALKLRDIVTSRQTLVVERDIIRAAHGLPDFGTITSFIKQQATARLEM